MDSRFSDDMNIEILSRTSLKTLDAIRCTSKQFEKLTYEWNLLHISKKRSNLVSGFLVEKTGSGWNTYVKEFAASRESNTIDLGFLPRNAQILASSEQGIMVFQRPHPRVYGLISYFVSKPATKQVSAIPNPKTKYITWKVAIVVTGSNPLHYKILRLSRFNRSSNVLQTKDNIYSTYICEIFDSRTWAWRRMELLKLPYCVCPANPQPITARGSIYMLLSNNEIVKFDAYSEKWTTFSSPVIESDYDPVLVKHEGRLGLACKPAHDGSWEIWIRGSDESWERRYVFNGEEEEEEEEEDVNARKSFDDSNISLTADGVKMLFYKGNTIDKVERVHQFYRMFVYRSDLELVDLEPGRSRP